MTLLTFEYQSITGVSGPLIFVEGVTAGSLGEMVDVHLSTGEMRRGQILQMMEGMAVVQVLEGTTGIDTAATKITINGDTAKIGLSIDILGRFYNGLGETADGLSPIIPDVRLSRTGLRMNP